MMWKEHFGIVLMSSKRELLALDIAPPLSDMAFLGAEMKT
jgi:hypothetical protein